MFMYMNIKRHAISNTYIVYIFDILLLNKEHYFHLIYFWPATVILETSKTRTDRFVILFFWYLPAREKSKGIKVERE